MSESELKAAIERVRSGEVGMFTDTLSNPDHPIVVVTLDTWNRRPIAQAEVREADGWQDIASAPKGDDMARIFAFDGERVGEAEAYTDYNEDNNYEGGLVWRWANDSCSCCWGNPVRPITHWRPLPAPPAALAGSRAPGEGGGA